MKILVAIPHFVGPKSAGPNGSTKGNRTARAAALQRCVQSLHEQFGESQCCFSLRDSEVRQANAALCGTVDIVVCTTGDCHALNELGLDSSYFEHWPTAVEPKLLGFECHAILRARASKQYDYYCFMEDDLITTDAWFFEKLAAFGRRLSPRELVLPHRFERHSTAPLLKAYIDGPLARPFLDVLRECGADLGNGHCQRIVPFLDAPVVLRSAGNPHAGCFFLTREQLDFWVRQPHFLDRDVRFVGPLESAATLSISKTFYIYKPTLRMASVLEIEHCGDAWIDRFVNRLR